MKNLIAVYGLPTIITMVIGISAVFSPILTALINNHYQLKFKKLDMKQSQYENSILHKREVFENYLKLAGKIVGTDINIKHCDEPDYYDAYFLVLPYAPQQLRAQIQELNKFIECSDKKSAVACFETLAPEIQNYLNQLYAK